MTHNIQSQVCNKALNTKYYCKMMHSHKTLVIYTVHGNTVKSTQTVITYSENIVPIDPVQQYIHSCVRDGGASEQLGGEPKMQNTLEGVWGHAFPGRFSNLHEIESGGI